MAFPKLRLTLLALSLFTAATSLAGTPFPLLKAPTPYSDLATLAGYEPSLLPSEAAAQKMYNLLPTSVFTRHSGCYQRAHYWSHELSREYDLRSMKVFLFFTERYHREFNYQWGFHVAPLIPTLMNDGHIEDLVFDPVFLSPPSWTRPEDRKNYDQKPVTVAQWSRYFVYPETICPVIHSYQEYIEQQDLAYCFIMKTPMYNYSPLDFDRDESGASGSIGSDWYDSNLKVRTNWRPGDLDNMEKGLKD
jgi:hypothetical protein